MSIILCIMIPMTLGFGYGCVAMVNKTWVLVGIFAPLLLGIAVGFLSTGYVRLALTVGIPFFLILYWIALALGYYLVFKAKDK